jgi:hypothetical protein
VTDQPSPTIAPPTPEPTVSPEASIEPTPLPPPAFTTGLEASDQFWEPLYNTCWFGAFGSPSMAQLTRNSDLVIVGRIVDLFIGEMYELEPGVRWPLSYLRVAITEIIKGKPASRDVGSVEIQMHSISPEDVDVLRERLPGGDHLWFLKLEDPAERDPANQSPIAPYAYYLSTKPQVSVLRNVDGRVEVIRPDAIAQALGREHFPVPLDGTDFDELVRRVRELAGTESAGPGVRTVQARPRDADAHTRFAC